MTRKLISVVIPCYNEAANIVPLVEAITSIFRSRLASYDYEFVISDNKSTDGTRDLLHELCVRDPNVRVLYNDRCYIQGFSLGNAIMHASGDAVIIMYADFQDPPELIPEFVAQWEAGHKVIPAVRTSSADRPAMRLARRLYYFLLRHTSGLNIIPGYTGSGCYDKEFIDLCKANMSHLFAMRLFVAKHGYGIRKVEFKQPARKGGRSSNNLESLFREASDTLATNYSKRIPFYVISVSIAGGILSILGGLAALARKLLFWDEVSGGVAPLLLMLLVCLFVQNFLYAQLWVSLNRIEELAFPDTPRLATGGNSLIDWCVRQARRLPDAIERTDAFVPIAGYAGIALTVGISLVYFVYKLVRWDTFSIGIVPSLLIVCLIVALQFAIGGVLNQNLKRSYWALKMRNEPLVVVERRENFGDSPDCTPPRRSPGP